MFDIHPLAAFGVATSFRQFLRRFASEIPGIGSYTLTQCQAGARYFTFCIQTEKILPSDTGGAICRCIVVKPRFLLHNGFAEADLFVRQHRVTACKPVSMRPGLTVPLYWWENTDPRLLFEFKPGNSLGYAWYGEGVSLLERLQRDSGCHNFQVRSDLSFRGVCGWQSHRTPKWSAWKTRSDGRRDIASTRRHLRDYQAVSLLSVMALLLLLMFP